MAAGRGAAAVQGAAALATVDLVQREYAANAARTGEYFISKLRELKLRYDCIGDVRGKGLMLGMELVKVPAGGDLGMQHRSPQAEDGDEYADGDQSVARDALGPFA